jgi:hypothetical protein
MTNMLGLPRYGNRSFTKMYRDINTLRDIIRAEGSPAVLEAWDRCEPFIDVVFIGHPRQERSEPMQCAECDCGNPPHDCNWIKAGKG